VQRLEFKSQYQKKKKGGNIECVSCEAEVKTKKFTVTVRIHHDTKCLARAIDFNKRNK
jgi:hypothetical protein